MDGAETDDVDEADESELPDESEQPEKEILQMCRSRGLDDRRRWLKLLLRTCMVTRPPSCGEPCRLVGEELW